jgi:hypothetical protein
MFPGDPATTFAASVLDKSLLPNALTLSTLALVEAAFFAASHTTVLATASSVSLTLNLKSIIAGSTSELAAGGGASLDATASRTSEEASRGGGGGGGGGRDDSWPPAALASAIAASAFFASLSFSDATKASSAAAFADRGTSR